MEPISSLSGMTVLVVEDDFYLAEDAREVLEEAGAAVLGPCSTPAAALALMAETKPDCAVLDLNLGNGPSFDLARALMAEGVPMLLATGYDDAVIPPDLADIPRLQKPIDPRRLVATLAGIRRAGHVEP